MGTEPVRSLVLYVGEVHGIINRGHQTESSSVICAFIHRRQKRVALIHLVFAYSRIGDDE